MLVFSTPVVNKRLSNHLPDSPHISHDISSSFSLQNFAVSLQCETSEKYLFRIQANKDFRFIFHFGTNMAVHPMGSSSWKKFTDK
jgi:hypothetical protein